MSEATLEQKMKLQRPPRLVPGWIVVGLVTLAVAGIALIQITEFLGDVAIHNLLSFLLAMIAVSSLGGWFVFVSSYPLALRVASVAAVAAGIGGFFYFYQLERVSGSMVPEFRLRRAPAKDAALQPAVAREVEDEARVDLAVETPSDFPQFLGPQRSAVLSTVKLQRDWKAHPPQLVWKQDIGAGWSAFAARNGFAVTLEQRGDEELVTCYEVATGRLRWSHTEKGRHATLLGYAGPRSTPTIDGGRVYTMGAFGIVLCLEGATGKPRWRLNLYEELGLTQESDGEHVAWGRSGSPLIVGNLVIVPAGGVPGKTVSIFALNKDTGEIVWRGGTQQVSYASPSLATLAGREQILVVGEKTIAGHDPKSGEVLWETEWPGNSNGDANASQIHPLTTDEIFVSKGYGVGAARFRLTKDEKGHFATEELWSSRRVLRTKFTNVAFVDGYLYGLNDGVLECVDAATGEAKWKGRRRRDGDYGQGQVLAVGNALLVQAENGDVALVDLSPEQFTELGRVAVVKGTTWNNLCLTGPYLLVRNAEQAACLELALEK